MTINEWSLLPEWEKQTLRFCPDATRYELAKVRLGMKAARLTSKLILLARQILLALFSGIGRNKLG
jgi:hypothetical protein